MEYKLTIEVSDTKKLEYSTSNEKLYIPDEMFSSVNILEASLETSGLTATLVNTLEKNVSKDLYDALNSADQKLYGSKCTLYSDSTVMFVGRFAKFNSDVYENIITIELENPMDSLTKELFARELGEYIDYNGVLETDALVNARIPTGFTCTTRRVDPDDAENLEVYKVISFTGTFSLLLEGIFRMVYGDPGNEAGASFKSDDTLFDYIDSDELLQFSKNDNENYIDVDIYYEWKEVFSSPLEFIKNKMFKIAGVYPKLLQNNKIGFSNISKSNVITTDLKQEDYFKVTSNETDYSMIINQISIENEYDFVENFYYKKDMYIQADSYDKLGGLFPDTPFKVDMQLVNIDQDQAKKDNFKKKCKDRIFKRFKNTTKTIKVDIPLTLTEYMSSSFVKFYNADMVDWITGAKGINGLVMEVVYKKNSFQTNTTELTLLYSELS